jgi:2'-5' RNA ligase
VIVVHEASFLQSFREEQLQRPGVTMPPHVTVRSPFLPAAAIDEEVRRRLRRICASFECFTFILDRIGRFKNQGVLYLAPEPTESLCKLSKAISEEFLLYMADNRRELDKIEQTFRLKYADQLPIQALATDISLYERAGQIWVQDSEFPLRTAE